MVFPQKLFGRTERLSEKWIAIGDIHGCPQQLAEVLEKCKVYPEHHLVFLGDYVDCGPNAGKVLQMMQHLDRDATFLLGNHDDELLADWEKIKYIPEYRKRFLEYKNISADDIKFLQKRTVLSHELESAFFSHAGIDDLYDLKEQPRQALLWSSPREELDHVTDKQVVQGHSVFPEVTCFGNHWFVDTGCGRGGKLSALVWPEVLNLQSDSDSEAAQKEW